MLCCRWDYVCLVTGGVFYGSHIPTAREQSHWEPRQTHVVMTEALAPIVGLCSLGDRLRNRRILLLVDSEAVEGAFVKGDSAARDLCSYAGLLWHVALHLELGLYVERVPTDGNPADDPSRRRFDHLKRLGAVLLPAAAHLRFTEDLDRFEDVEAR